MFETFEHTADLGLRIQSPSLEELFVEAAQGLFSLVVANLADVRPVIEKSFQVAGSEADLLLFDWLSELLFVIETEHLLLAEFQVSITPGVGLSATARGEPMDATRHRLEHEVKAITYHALKLDRTENGWQAEVIVDI